MQVSWPQHSVSRVHTPDSARQQRLVPLASAQVVPVAHPGCEPGVQVEPAGSGVLPFEQVLPAQVRPLQHSEPDAQAEPAALQRRQVPPMHWSAGFVHVGLPPPIAAQHCCPSPPQTGVLCWQRFDWQLRPALQARPLQQASPESPHDMPELA